MPITFTEIEKQKSWRISFLFIVLLILYFCLITVMFHAFTLIFPFHFMTDGYFLFRGNPLYFFLVLTASLMTAGLHFFLSAYNAVESIMETIGAVKPDPDDGIHRRLRNIVDEIHVASGCRKKIQCMVIPSLSMNALAVADIKGNAAIAITEGLLSRLSRPQLESVIAHEAYHILSGDCLEATAATSLFGMYASALEKLRNFWEEDPARFSCISPVFVLFCILLKLSQMLNMFISREREYRADAAAVRMTRNPFSMAEALYMLSRNWKGSGMISSGLEMLCIVPPQLHSLDEIEGRWANLMSTHPPLRKRIDVLLKFAHSDFSVLEKRANAKTSEKANAGEPLYFALDAGHQWQGPYKIAELVLFPWFSPMTWIRGEQVQSVERVSENVFINNLLADRLKRSGKEGLGLLCPCCRQPLGLASYEKTQVYQCHFCRGFLMENSKIPRLIVREHEPCSERVRTLAMAVMNDNQRKLSLKKIKRPDFEKAPVIHCPKCSKPMFRTFYSLAYLIEIDRCGICGLTWFDADELEMLQCVIENTITAKLDLPVESF